MAVKKNIFVFESNSKRSHGRHAKSRTTFNKGSNNYTKKYRGQGR
jgi:hypothetical protein